MTLCFYLILLCIHNHLYGLHSIVNENIAITRQVVEYAHARGVVVEAELGTLAGVEDEEFAAWYLYRKFHPKVLVVTQGSRGGILITEDKMTRYPAYAVDAKDTNGAGDVFHGAWIAASLMGKDPYEATCFASAASAIKCTHFGASEGAPRLAEVEAFLKERGAL